jgi:hypothetical protein
MLNKIIYWLPRVLSLVFIAFLSIFALDVFEQYQGWDAILPLLIHLLPSFVLLLAVMVAWKYELVGACLFGLAAVGYVGMVGLDRPWSWYAVIDGPALVISMLFILGWWRKKCGRK